ncbi:hypothetical protein BS78_K006000 [Paspalum vaginatum]|uniref:Uncharacterized protein n=1 Tax=Paspalum vaginatum TaxID=158149 RepID=A0A9W8CG63_9POAL|nr:hypothetical protein BS78_K006000 [Paspalum vaginatum]
MGWQHQQWCAPAQLNARLLTCWPEASLLLGLKVPNLAAHDLRLRSAAVVEGPLLCGTMLWLPNSSMCSSAAEHVHCSPLLGDNPSANTLWLAVLFRLHAMALCHGMWFNLCAMAL